MDWDRYYNCVEKLLTETKETCSNEKRDIRYCDLTKIIYKAVNIASGRKESWTRSENKSRTNNNKKNRKNPVKWWDAECKSAIQERKDKLKKYLLDGSMESFIDYKRSRAIARKTIKTKKRESFINFCNGINRWTSLSYVWRTVKILKNSVNNTKSNNWQSSDRERRILEEINRIAQPNMIPRNEQITPFKYDTPEDPMNAMFTMEELNRAINCIKKVTTPGIDGIDYTMIKRLPNEFRKALLKVINDIWTTMNIPEDWRIYQIHFIDKIDKKKVRPIALSSCLGKLMERMVNERLIWWAENGEIIHYTQHGFRRGRSCSNNLAKITSDIKSSLYRDEYTLAAFVDVSAAYDNVPFHILSKKLIKYKCPSR